MITILDSHITQDSFNQKALHPLQSWEWGEARKKMGIAVLRIGEFEQENLNATYQITLHPLSKTGFTIGYLPRSVLPSKNVLAFLTDYGKKNNVIFFKIEPYVFESYNQSPTTYLQPLIKSPHPLFPEWTQMLNLTRKEEDLMKNMKQKTRYNIRLAQKKGVIVKEVSDEKGFDIFSRLYFDTCKRQKYYGHTIRYHRIIWESLKANIAHLLIAFYENTPVAAYELFYFNDTFYYTYGGTSLEFRNVMGANLLMWEAILLGKRLGAKRFDMWGSLAPHYDDQHSWSGFTRFKEGYGTEFKKTIGSYDLVVNPLLYSIYNTVYAFRESYLALKKML